MSITDAGRDRLLRRGIRLELMTTGWNIMEVIVTVALGVAAKSLALVAFGLDSLMEVFASMVVIWHLRDGRRPTPHRTNLAFKLIAIAFLVLAAVLLVASVRSLVLGSRPEESVAGIAFLGLTAVVMFTLATVKRRTAAAIDSGPLGAEASMTFLDGCLSVGILSALGVNLLFGWSWADGLAALAVAGFAVREGLESLREARQAGGPARAGD